MVVSKAYRNELNIRNHRILEMYGLGYSLRKIAKMENLTPERISQIVKKMNKEDIVKELKDAYQN